MSTEHAMRRRFFRMQLNDQADARLLMFPFAGGSAAAYQPLLKRMPDDIDVLVYQMPGHGTRFSEPLCQSVAELIEDICEFLPMLTDKPLYLFGHSLGGRVAHALCRQLQTLKQALPRMVIMSASRPPDIANHNPMSHLPDRDFLQRLRIYDGIPAEILENDAMMELFLPAIKTDMRVFESYQCEPDRPLMTPVVIWGGADDSYSPLQDVVGWNRFFAIQKEFRSWPGGHFYINQSIDAVAKGIVTHVRDSMERYSMVRGQVS
ncbi:thioesterase II family protein [Gynuella sunshinyii]|uniref:Thioesterase n=1 Tax=Gynuella sunshinyii YC6258 TaxID=1445510 RepID=A0A0C5VM50_9GAMM|nr:alpha/beta fold hydrolase [Gynuella sunshinyii]AJQ95772.1 putative thioesterase involved in non-ribosomal peptide biosynthesis [Gynuella sunshinyii YC6258]DAC80065.1 TPA_exp: thioesterase [Gynuella sunshinyii YC6258]